ncbi:hypothetical protein EV697_101435 [Bisgaardia hudsonensis]|uniref:Uncharacterized protein n=1 Tax=Bisgaardia hudsonensis TaxID=109472 RepID=A0A4R2N390_9PAST|nr:hypothetical protein [Bisgaardia hudsonensis]QLB12744.1 hypothetical protein A6A11_03545 [Bisgaardia hudsonensis]TCP14295.1 hypothetical protein EV697_101435 [Bisgaardia hudsonensis]
MNEEKLKKYDQINSYLNEMIDCLELLNPQKTFNEKKAKKHSEKINNFLSRELNYKKSLQTILINNKGYSDDEITKNIEKNLKREKNDEFTSDILEVCIHRAKEIENELIKYELLVEFNRVFNKSYLFSDYNNTLKKLINLSNNIYDKSNNIRLDFNIISLIKGYKKIIHAIFWAFIIIFGVLLTGYLERYNSFSLLLDLNVSNILFYFGLLVLFIFWFMFFSLAILFMIKFYSLKLGKKFCENSTNYKINNVITISLFLLISVIAIFLNIYLTLSILDNYIPIIMYVMFILAFLSIFIFSDKFYEKNSFYYFISIITIFYTGILSFFVPNCLFIILNGNKSDYEWLENIQMEFIGMRDKQDYIYWVNKDYLNMSSVDSDHITFENACYLEIESVNTNLKEQKVDRANSTFKQVNGKILFRTNNKVIFLPSYNQETDILIIDSKDIYRQ